MKQIGKKKKGITMDDLAAMTQRGFEEMHIDMGKKFADVYKRFDTADKRFDGIDQRLDRIEFLLIGTHDRRLDKIEDDMRVMKTLLEKKFSVSLPK